MKKKESFLCLVLFLFLAACGQTDREVLKQSSRSKGGGSLKLIVHRSKGISLDEMVTKVERFKVIIEGENIKEPIMKEFSGEVERGIIEDVPVGSVRVKIQAVNGSEYIIREGEEEEVTIEAGRMSSVDIDLVAIPMIINVRNGNVISTDRLRLKLYSDPGDILVIEDVDDSGGNALFDISTGQSDIVLSESLPTIYFQPEITKVGEHRFRVSSKKSGKFSETSIRIINSDKLNPAPLYNGGDINLESDYVIPSRIATPWQTSSGGIIWSNILEQQLYGY